MGVSDKDVDLDSILGGKYVYLGAPAALYRLSLDEFLHRDAEDESTEAGSPFVKLFDYAKEGLPIGMSLLLWPDPDAGDRLFLIGGEFKEEDAIRMNEELHEVVRCDESEQNKFKMVKYTDYVPELPFYGWPCPKRNAIVVPYKDKIFVLSNYSAIFGPTSKSRGDFLLHTPFQVFNVKTKHCAEAAGPAIPTDCIYKHLVWSRFIMVYSNKIGFGHRMVFDMETGNWMNDSPVLLNHSYSHPLPQCTQVVQVGDQHQQLYLTYTWDMYENQYMALYLLSDSGDQVAESRLLNLEFKGHLPFDCFLHHLGSGIVLCVFISVESLELCVLQFSHGFKSELCFLRRKAYHLDIFDDPDRHDLSDLCPTSMHLVSHKNQSETSSSYPLKHPSQTNDPSPPPPKRPRVY